MDFCKECPSSRIYQKGPVNFSESERALYYELSDDLSSIRHAILAQDASPIAFAEGVLGGIWTSLAGENLYLAAGCPKIQVVVVSIPAHSEVLALGFVFASAPATLRVVIPEDPRNFYVYASALPNVEYDRIHSIKYVDIVGAV